MPLLDSSTRPFSIVAPESLPDPIDDLIRDVRAGLGNTPRWLPPKYLYDAHGSDLYVEITELPEYYPFRTERAMLLGSAADIVDKGRPQAVVEFGSGAASKTRILLDAADDRGTLNAYGAIEVSESALSASLEDMAERYDVDLEGYVADFGQVSAFPFPDYRRLILFLGSTIGNLDEEEAVAFLRRVAGGMDDDDTLLVGFDLVKETGIVEAAYNDEAGVTAAFNLNVLRRINRDLGATFDLSRFHHSAFFNEEASQIEMHLVSEGDQSVDLGDADMRIHMLDGESIRTEISRKFTKDDVARMSEAAGLEQLAWYEDQRGYFGLCLFRARDSRRGDAR